MRSLALIGVLAACGDGLSVPDASVLDDTQRALVTVEVRSGRVGSGARVFFQQHDSQLLLATRTDPQGHASAYVSSTGFVTIELVDRSEGNARLLFTQADVSPGDHVVLDDGTLFTATEFTVTVPEEPQGLLDGFTLYSRCGVFTQLATEQPIDLSLTNCGSTASMMVLSPFNNFLYTAHVPIVVGGSVRFTGTYEPFRDEVLRVTNVPPDIQFVQAKQTLLDGSRELFTLPQEAFLSFDGFETTAETTMPTPTWDDARVLTRLTAQAGAVGVPSVWEWGPRGEPTTIDWGVDAVRRYQTRPSYAAESNLVGWIEADRGRLADAALITMRWTHVDDDGATTSVDWRMFAPRREEAWITMPVLPDPVLQPTTGYVDDVTNFAIDGGYERLRKLPLLGQWHPGQFPPSAWPIDAPTGRVTFQSSGFGRRE